MTEPVQSAENERVWLEGGSEADWLEGRTQDADDVPEAQRMAEWAAAYYEAASALAEALTEWVDCGGDETKSRAALALWARRSDGDDNDG